MVSKYNRQDNAWEFNTPELDRLDINYENKVILIIRADLWQPYSDRTADVEIRYYKTHASEPVTIQKVKTSTPYPNKNITSAVVNIGRKKTRHGIPIIFDTLDELRDIYKIQIIWKLKHPSFDQYIDCVIVDYDVNFDNPTQKAIYGLHNYIKQSFDMLSINDTTNRPKYVLINSDDRIEIENTGCDFDDMIIVYAINDNDSEKINNITFEETIVDLHYGENRKTKADIMNRFDTGSVYEILNNMDFPEMTVSYYRRKLTMTDDVIVGI